MLTVRLQAWQVEALGEGEAVLVDLPQVPKGTVRVQPPQGESASPRVRSHHVRHLRQEMAATLRKAAATGVQSQESGTEGRERVTPLADFSLGAVDPRVAEGRVPQGPRQVFAGAYSAHDAAKLAGHRAALLEDQVRAVREAETPPPETAAARIQRLTAASGATVAEATAAWRTAFGQSEPDPKYAGWALKHRTPPEVRDGDQANTLHLHVRVGPYVLATLTKLAERLQVDLPDVLEEVLVMGCEALEAGL